MNFADVAEKVLDKAAGGPLRYEEITNRAIQLGLIAPKSDQPWVYMASAINADNRARRERGERQRFVSPVRGSVQLTAPSSEPEKAIERWNEQSKRKLLDRLHTIDPYLFERIVADLLSRIGFEDTETTSRSKDDGIDVKGTMDVGGLTKVATVIQVKRWKSNKVGSEHVRNLRGSLEGKQQGLIVTLSDFTPDAVREAGNRMRGEVTLINGSQLVDLMAEHDLGLIKKDFPVLYLAEEAFLHETDEGEPEAKTATKGDSGTTGVRVAEPPSNNKSTAVQSVLTLPTLPGRPNRYFDSLLRLLEFSSHQPTVEEFIDRFQKKFPSITKRTEAKRRAIIVISLGLARIDGDRIALTPEGNAVLRSRNSQLVRDAILKRIPGAEEVDEALRATREPQKVLQIMRAYDISETQVTNIRKWLDVLR